MRKLNKVEVVEKTPNPYLKHREGILPNSFHKVETHKVPTGDCNKIYYANCIPCPWINQYVIASECEPCKYGKAGNYSEGWILCNYDGSEQKEKPHCYGEPNELCSSSHPETDEDCEYLQECMKIFRDTLSETKTGESDE